MWSNIASIIYWGYLIHKASICKSVLVWKFPANSEEDFEYAIAVQPKCWSVDQTQQVG